MNRKANTAKSFTALFISFWLIGTVLGLSILWRYSLAPSHPAKILPKWPTQSKLQRPRGRATLVMVVHPECPCSSASIEELNRIIAKFPSLPVQILFYRPSAFPFKWEQGSLWQSAQRIPGVDVVTDEDGVEARLFGSQTSGQTMLYSANGDLVFSGGITGARGHAGDNDGETIVLAYLKNGTSAQTTTPTYGCSILDHRTQPSPKEIANAGS